MSLNIMILLNSVLDVKAGGIIENNFQNGFPSTIPTVNRTGDKLTVSSGLETEGEEEDEMDGACLLCGAHLDTETDARHNALQATQYSSYISGGGARAVNGAPAQSEGCGPCDKEREEAEQCCGEGDGACQSSRGQSVILAEVMECLCYTCRRTLDRLTSVDTLPWKLLEAVRARVRRTKMKSEISDFLL